LSNFIEQEVSTVMSLYAAYRFHAAFAGGRTVVHDTLARFTVRCKELNLPFAVMGGMAVAAHGYRNRVTHDVDVLMTRESLEIFKVSSIGAGWINKFEGSVGMKDATTQVPIDVLLTGNRPGSGKESEVPLTFPDPATEDLLNFGDAPHIGLARLIELKLASGMTDKSRARDIVDVMALIKCRDIGVEFAEVLHLFVREKFLELHGLVQLEKARRE
jgi:hypothetical protein